MFVEMQLLTVPLCQLLRQAIRGLDRIKKAR